MTPPGVTGSDRAQLEAVLALVQEVLGADLVGAYQHGSAVLGELRPRSDLDVLVVSRRGTTTSERRALVDRLLRISGAPKPGAPRPIELIVVEERAIRPWRYPPHLDFLYGEWLRPELEAGRLTPGSSTESPDLAVLITMALAGSRPLVGPPPSEVFAPVPPDDLRRAMVAGVEDLLAELGADTRNVLLTLARIWTTLATGSVVTKDRAADWALPRLPARPAAVLERARAIYLGEVEEDWTDLADEVAPCAQSLVRRIEAVRRHQAST
ncbi:MAG TPA: aminoglycoside adenylyltransferase family protein [Thermoanaerobaculia bacterium]|nr:aminoglycoside adenylyltransferase family protein [Thermoanaerobaculia bacterium]